MSGGTVVGEKRLDRRIGIAEALRSQWRLFDRVTLTPIADGDGFHATIHLDPVIVRGSAEQQGPHLSPGRHREAEERRSQAIAECVGRVNESLPQAEAIRAFIAIVPAQAA